uniref:GST N-terminal domain-containing protein n=1 Tax=Eutreptiella gymnastica TaxID=73025 RepID=A0A7S1NM55_9EUGL|mmetsp:Transcript_50893/g.90928  ORF Transcript_50893/g.90928 Transcript_50893/m.90928 type:complete len:602 (+) Transcript_50893:22-1827(+)
MTIGGVYSNMSSGELQHPVQQHAQPAGASGTDLPIVPSTWVPGGVSVDTPVFNGPVFNIGSYDNLPQPAETRQHLEPVEGNDDDPFAAKKFKLVTTHILPPVTVSAPASAGPVRREMIEKPVRTSWDGVLGELLLDAIAPDGLAVKLMLLEAKAPFIMHEVDLMQDNVRSEANPHGKVPCWIDQDGSCVWEANAIMRYICDKYDLHPQFYLSESGSLKTRTDMGLDWCHTALSLHINHVMDPDTHEQEDLSDLPGGRIALEKDYKVLTDYFLRETAFIGGDEPNIADYAICLELLMLYATPHPPPDRVRQYLHNASEHIENWNEVTMPIREFCMRRQLELRQANAEMDRYRYEEDLNRRNEFTLSAQHEDVERRQQEEYQLRATWEAEARQMEQEEQRRREEQDRRMKEEWERSRMAGERARQAEEESRMAELEEQRRRLEEEVRRRQNEEEAWQVEYEERMRRMREWEAKQGKTKANDNLRPQVGVEIKMLDDSKGNKDCIVVVERVVPDGPAHRAGLHDEDVIDMWNGDRLFSKAQWIEKVKGSQIGEIVTLSVYRDGEPQEVPLTIGGTEKTMGKRTVTSRGQVGHNIRYKNRTKARP